MSMLYLACSIATSAVLVGQLLLGRGKSRRSMVQLSVVVFFFLADFPLSTEDEVKQRSPWSPGRRPIRYGDSCRCTFLGSC